MKCWQSDDEESICSGFFILPAPIFWMIWIFGVLGNTVNLVVFNHSEMRKSTVNSLFWWLSLSDLFELMILTVLRVMSKNSSPLDLSMMCHSDSTLVDERFFIISLTWFVVYLLIAVHSCTVLLNITLVILRYAAVRHPFRHRSENWDPRSVKRITAWIYILSFITFSPTLFGVYVHLPAGNITHLPKGDYSSASRPVYIFRYVLLFGMIVRVGSFIVLIIGSSMLIFAVVQTRRSYQRSPVSSEAARTERSMRQINTLIIIILVMFFISDANLTLEGFTTIQYIRNTLDGRDGGASIHSFFQDLKVLTACTQWFTILVNCSYSTFCYFIFSTAYQNTFKKIIHDRYGFVTQSTREHSADTHELRNLQPND